MYQRLNTTRNHLDNTANIVFSHFRSYSKIKKFLLLLNQARTRHKSDVGNLKSEIKKARPFERALMIISSSYINEIHCQNPKSEIAHLKS